jgi:serine/threonine protein kinase
MERMPTAFGRYSLVRKIGTGGMAEIWKARVVGPAGFEKTLAIKKVLPDLVANEQFLEMFVEEAKLVANLAHPNIVQVFDFGQVDERDYFIAMEYVAGTNLATILSRLYERRLRLPPEIALYVALEACKGLGHAHARTGPAGEALGIVHRDVSPQNVLVSFGGEVKVTDFGIAKVSTAISRTGEGQVRGKLSYMSPEQAGGTVLDRRSDLFSLAVVLYELVAGKRFYSGDSSVEIFAKVLNYRSPSAEDFRELPPVAVPILLKGLRANPDERWQNAVQMETALANALGPEGAVRARQALSALMTKLFDHERKLELAPSSDEVATGVSGEMGVVRPATPSGSLSRPFPAEVSGPKTPVSPPASGLTLKGKAVAPWDAPKKPVAAAAPSRGGLYAMGGAGVLVTIAVAAASLHFFGGRPAATPTPTPIAAVTTAVPEPTPEVRPTATHHAVAKASAAPVASAAPTAAPTQVAMSGTATVSVAARPWVEVWIDGKQVSRDTPLRNWSLPAGTHSFKFVNPAESFTLTKSIAIPGDRKTSIFVDVTANSVTVE